MAPERSKASNSNGEDNDSVRNLNQIEMSMVIIINKPYVTYRVSEKNGQTRLALVCVEKKLTEASVLLYPSFDRLPDSAQSIARDHVFH